MSGKLPRKVSRLIRDLKQTAYRAGYSLLYNERNGNQDAIDGHETLMRKARRQLRDCILQMQESTKRSEQAAGK